MSDEQRSRMMVGRIAVGNDCNKGELRSPSAEARAEGEGFGTPAVLRAHVASGIRWGFIASAATQIGRLFFLVALMRLLGPESFGIVGQAAIFVAIAQILVHFGMAASIVQSPRLDQSEIGTAFWLNITLGLLLAAVMVVGAPLASIIFKTAEITAVLHCLSISIILKSISIVPSALLTRSMRFRDLATAEIVSTFFSGIIGIGAALIGADYWALVIQVVSLEAAYLILIIRAAGLPDLTWSGTTARRLWSFSSRLMGADLVNYASANSDKFLVAWMLGPIALGLYSLAFRVPQLIFQVFAQVGRVILPTFAHLQDDRERLARAFLDLSESIALAVCPAMTLAILCAPLGVPAVFGEVWSDAAVPFQLLAAMTIPCILVSFMGPLTIAVGRANWEFYWAIGTTVTGIVAFSIGLLWGIVGMAAANLIIVSAQLPIRLVVIKRLIPIRARDYVQAMLPSIVCSLVLAIVWLLAEALLERTLSGLVLLAVTSGLGAAAYVIALWKAWPNVLHRQLDFVQLVLRRKQG